MKKTLIFLIISFLASGFSMQEGDDILRKVENNMSSDNRIFEATMIIHGTRNTRTMTLKTYSVGTKQSFTEYLSPARDQGTKMLKLANQLWIYSPSTDRIIQISGSLLRQSVMGSDLSYEDMMDDRKLTDVYSAAIEGNETIDGRNTVILKLTAKVTDIAYYTQKLWVDTERFIPLREEFYAKSGQLLKRTSLSDVKQISGRWFPTKIVYKDMLKQGDGTEFQFTSVQFNQPIPDYIFTKAALKQ
jgi:outer membrane lipoprotein-sorting protein